MFKSYLLLGYWVEALVESAHNYLAECARDCVGNDVTVFVRAYPKGESRALIVAESTLNIFNINSIFNDDHNFSELTVLDTQWSHSESRVCPGMMVNRVTFLVEGFTQHRETVRDTVPSPTAAADFRRHHVLQD